MTNKNSNEKSLFKKEDQEKVVLDNQHLLEIFKDVKDIKEWNKVREEVKKNFKGTPLEELMLFGYIDGVLKPKIL